VEFELVGDHAHIRKARKLPGGSARGRIAVDLLRGAADIRMITDEILALTRGEPRARRRRKRAAFSRTCPRVCAPAAESW